MGIGIMMDNLIRHEVRQQLASHSERPMAEASRELVRSSSLGPDRLDLTPSPHHTGWRAQHIKDKTLELMMVEHMAGDQLDLRPELQRNLIAMAKAFVAEHPGFWHTP